MSKEKIHGKYDVWDWIVDKKGTVRQITHDDMQDLKYEDIARHAEPAEVELKRAFPFNGYAPGHYTCYCNRCKKDFMGDKRAFTCLKCAVELAPAPAAPESRGGEPLPMKRAPMAIVNDLYELAGLSVEQRQSLNDDRWQEAICEAAENYAAERQRGEGAIKIKCPDCDGLTFTLEHDTFDPHEGGECSGSCPVQVQCATCKATGEIELSIEEIVRKIFYSPATNGQAEKSIADGIALVSALLDKAREENLSEFFKWLEKSEFRYDYGRFYTETYANRTSETKFFTHEHVFAAFLAGKEGKNV